MRRNASVMLCRRPGHAKEEGIVLVTSLVMLVMLTLFVISAIRLSNINLQIVGNYQWQRTMEIVADSALEQVISNAGNFAIGAAGRDVCQNGTVVVSGGCTITNPRIGGVTAPQCDRSVTATGYTKKLGELAPQDNSWILTASVVDSVSGAAVRIHRGIMLRQLVGNCPG